jgi:NADPH:quinone reductase-like Zn-dependent oxidoreductase
MKAAVIDAPGDSAHYGDFAEPGEQDGRQVVELVAAAIHPIVRGLASGQHYGSSDRWPLVPGVDAVVRSTEGALAFSGYPQPPYGTLAERISVPSFLWNPLPKGADPARVAGGVNPGMASWLPLQARRTEIGKLDTVLILGVTGMTGFLAVQNARILGATHIAGAGRDARALADAGKAGATTIALSGDRERDAAAILHALEGSTPDIVLDFLWGAPAESTFAALGRRGLESDRADIAYVQIGAAAGPEAAVPAALLRSRRLRITGSGAGSASLTDIIAEIPRYIQLIADRTVDVPIRTFPLSLVSEAWAAAERGRPRVVVLAG